VQVNIKNLLDEAQC
jgi:transposase-like protein